MNEQEIYEDQFVSDNENPFENISDKFDGMENSLDEIHQEIDSLKKSINSLGFWLLVVVVAIYFFIRG